MAEHLRAAYSSQALRQYYLEKFPHWPPEAPDDIDWYIKGQALKSLHGRHQKTILQMMHGWLPVNAHPGSGNSDDTQNCPYCLTTPETMFHFLSCTHQSAVLPRQVKIRAIQQHLRSTQTHPDMCQVITSALDTNNGDMPISTTMQAIQAKQSIIGWDHVLKGNLTLEWVKTYDRIHRTTSGEQWCISLLRKIWSEFYIVWKARCDHKHGTEAARHRQNLLRDLTPRVIQLFKAKDQLLHIDQTFFRSNQEAILQLPNGKLENWVYKAERHVRSSRIRATREQRKHRNATMTSFYPVFNQPVRPTKSAARATSHPVQSAKKNETSSTTLITNTFVRKKPPLRNPYAKPKPARPKPAPTRLPPTSTTTYLTSYFHSKPKDSFPHHNTEKPP
jgi:hypothetical protein